MPAEMKVKEETPTKIILETDSSRLKWAEYLRMLGVPPLLLIGILFITNFPTWLDWIIIALALLIETVMIVVVSSELTSAMVTIDSNSERAK